MKKQIVLSLFVLAALAVFVSFLYINARTYAGTTGDDDSKYTTARSNITRLLGSKDYRQALVETLKMFTETAKKSGQPMFVQRRQLMETLALAAQAYEGRGNNERALISANKS